MTVLYDIMGCSDSRRLQLSEKASVAQPTAVLENLRGDSSISRTVIVLSTVLPEKTNAEFPTIRDEAIARTMIVVEMRHQTPTLKGFINAVTSTTEKGMYGKHSVEIKSLTFQRDIAL